MKQASFFPPDNDATIHVVVDPNNPTVLIETRTALDDPDVIVMRIHTPKLEDLINAQNTDNMQDWIDNAKAFRRATAITHISLAPYLNHINTLETCFKQRNTVGIEKWIAAAQASGNAVSTTVAPSHITPSM